MAVLGFRNRPAGFIRMNYDLPGRMTGTRIKHRGYSYRYGGKNIRVPAHYETHDRHIETEAEYYAAFELERQGWNVGLPLRRNQKGFDLYA
jgi:hypothetical protein